MSSTPSLHVCVAVLILLLAAFSNVQSVHTKTLNRLRLRERRDYNYNSGRRSHRAWTVNKDFSDKSVIHDKDQNLTDYGTLDTNSSSVLQGEQVINSTLDVFGTNASYVIQGEQVINSTLDVFGTSASSVSQREQVTHRVSDTVNSNARRVSKKKNITISTLDVIGAYASVVPRRENILRSTTDMINTNVSSVLQTENMIRPTLDVLEGTNVSSVPIDENMTRPTLDVSEDTNVSSVPIDENMTRPTLDVLEDTNVSSVPMGENVTHSILDAFGTDTSYVSQIKNVTSSTLEFSETNDNLTTQSGSSEGRQSRPFNSNISSVVTLDKHNQTYLNSVNKTHNVGSNNLTHIDWQGDLQPHLQEEGDDYSWNNDVHSNHSSSEGNSNDTDPLTDSGCMTCRVRAIDRHYRILQFKNQILNSLHMTNVPNTTGIPIPKVPALTHLYDMDLMSDSPGRNGLGGKHADSDDDFVVKTERIFLAAKEAPLALHLNLTDTVYFPPAVQLFTSDIKSAYLWFYIRKHKSPPPFVSIESIVPQSKPGRTFITKKVFSLKLAKEKAFGWKRVDLRDTLRQWIKHPMTNFGLQIKAEDSSGNNLIVLPPAPDIDKGYEPWLDTKIVEHRHNSRRRRSESLMCADNITDSRCCRHSLLVGFAEFGWYWIIAPTHVNADYCTGECRMTMQDNTPYSWVNQQMPGTNSCCTPTKLQPLPLLYFDDSMNIVYQILQDMKVDRCGCA